MNDLPDPVAIGEAIILLFWKSVDCHIVCSIIYNCIRYLNLHLIIISDI